MTPAAQAKDDDDGKEAPLHLAPLQTLEDFIFLGEDKDSVYHANSSFRLGAAVGVAAWLGIVGLILYLAPESSYEEPTGIDQQVHVLSILFMIMTNGSRLLNTMLREKSRVVVKSGVLLASVAVQGIAIWAGAWMAFYPTPVMLDPISGQKFYLIRWAEWVSLTFLMSFLTKNIDRVGGQPQFGVPLLLMSAASCSFIFPQCTSLESWLTTLFVALTLFSSLFVVLFQKAERFAKMKDAIRFSKRPSATALELYHIARYGYVLTMTCTVTWVTLVGTFILVCLWPDKIPLAEHISKSTLLVIHACVNEVSSKYYYFSVLTDAYEMIFESSARLARRLEESRGFMAAVWEASSDVIVFASKKGQDRINVYVSMAFLRLTNFENGEFGLGANENWDSVFLDLHPAKDLFSVYLLNTSAAPETQDAVRVLNVSNSGELTLEGNEGKDIPSRNLTALARLVLRAFDDKSNDKQASFMDKDENPISCEATISHLKDEKIVCVLRNITDRIERFEAEKDLVRERAQRAKDEEINHFTRHEVKNGILTAMGIVEQLREHIDTSPQPAEAKESGNPFTDPKPQSSSDGLKKLDNSLEKVLDTILDEAMAREIIHGDYVPTIAAIEVKKELLSLSTGQEESHSFSHAFDPEPFPEVTMDRQLLRYIYRQAVSNASRYGRPDGVISTEVSVDAPNRKFVLKVLNEPGVGQKTLVDLSQDSIEDLFKQGTRLPGAEDTWKSTKESSASGSWVMRKCAEALGGTCNIRFEEHQTCFWFSCPTKVIHKPTLTENVASTAHFGLPENTWVVILEDSEIQRKLLNRCFTQAGIPLSRRVMLGKNAEEIHDFRHVVASLMMKHADDKFLLIVDENLDIVTFGGTRRETVSGSKSVKELRDGLPKHVEGRMLALIRSANDSARDVGLYLERAHGFLRKEPVRQGKILSTIEPYWKKRFPLEVKQVVDPSPSVDESILGPFPEDIRNALLEITSISKACNDSNQWPLVLDKLHALKGDLMTMDSLGSAVHIIVALDQLGLQQSMPKDFSEKWKELSEDVETLLGTGERP